LDGTVQVVVPVKRITQVLVAAVNVAVLCAFVWLSQAELARAPSSIAPSEKMLAIRKAGIPNFRRTRSGALFLGLFEVTPIGPITLGRKCRGLKESPGSTKP
jgi:hypothetical protein